MSIRVVERVDDWNQRQFTGGYDALRDLADEEFSGVVRVGGAELFVTVGTVLEVRRGTIEDVAGASGTAYEAPHPALPLLAVMQEADADVRAQYYTEETPISEVDQTLSDGGFTGFLELSENVLSGDYFMVYHGGNSMSVAYVGESERLLTDDEAFRTANDEVGIYKVRQVDVEPVEIPEAETAAAPPADTGSSADSAADEATAEDATDATEATTADATAAESDPEPTTETTTETTPQESTETDRSESAAQSGQDGAGGSTQGDAAGDRANADPDATASAEADVAPTDEPGDGPESRSGGESSAASTGDRGADAGGTEAGRGDPGRDPAARAERSEAETSERQSGRNDTRADRSAGGRGRETEGRSSQEEPARADSDRTVQAQSTGTGGTRDARQSGNGGTDRQRSPSGGPAGSERPTQAAAGQAGDLETRAVPSLDPDQTKLPSRDDGPSTGPAAAPDPGAAGGTTSSPPSAHGGESAGEPRQPRESTEQAGGSGEPVRTTDDRSQSAAESRTAEETDDQPAEEPVAAAEADLAELEAEIDRLESTLAETTQERDDLQADLEAVREERDELAAEVDRLETELQRLEEQFGAATDADRRMTPDEAVEGTNLFVDYDSKGKPTLEKAHGGTESREEVAENLQLGIHTEFDDGSVGVGGQSFDEFLTGTLHYRFAQWAVRDLLFEIRDTGHGEALEDLYDAIPEIRRVEFNGAVDVEYVEDGQEKTGREHFDVIFRHRMGDPLLVANLNDSREPATGGMMDSLVTAAERVGQTEDSLSAAFLVTSSFFESEALETVSEATRSGILSRDSRDSFVNLSRKTGYHLCLVAAREGNFHMEVPEL